MSAEVADWGTRRNATKLRTQGLLLGALFSFACSSQPAKSPEAVGKSAPEPIETAAIIVSPSQTVDVSEVLDAADEHFRSENYADALKEYRRAAENAAHDKRRLRGLFGWATCLDFLARPHEALEVYSRYASEQEPGPLQDRGRIRMVRLFVYLERYDEAARLARALVPKNFSSLEQVAIYAARSLALLTGEKLELAEKTIRRGLAIVDREGLARGQTMPLDVAALYFSLGELRRHRASEIRFVESTADFLRRLEERCQLILDAQSAFSESMRANDAHWSSMSGVRVGELYQHLHRDLIAMPRPPAADTKERQQLFDGALRLRYSILLRKSVAMMRATVSLLERQKQTTRWREKAKHALQEIEKAQQEEESAIDALPYSRLQLQQVLDEMAERGRKSAAGT